MNRIPIFWTEESLPPVCGGLEFRGVETYDDPNLGVGIRYQGPFSLHADVFLYDLGLSEIPQDLHSKEVIQIYQDSLDSLFAAAEAGRYLELENISTQYLHVPLDAPEPFCLWGIFTYRQAKGDDVLFTGKQVSHMTLRTDHGFINKVRYTYPDSEDTEYEDFEGFLLFLLEWNDAVQEFISFDAWKI